MRTLLVCVPSFSSRAAVASPQSSRIASSPTSTCSTSGRIDVRRKEGVAVASSRGVRSVSFLSVQRRGPVDLYTGGPFVRVPPFPPLLGHKRHGDGFGGVGVREVQGAPLDVRGGVWLRPHGGAVCAAVAVCAVALDGTAGRGARTHTGAARGPTRGRRKAATDGDRRRREYTQAAYAKDDVKTCSSLLPELKLGLNQP